MIIWFRVFFFNFLFIIGFSLLSYWYNINLTRRMLFGILLSYFLLLYLTYCLLMIIGLSRRRWKAGFFRLCCCRNSWFSHVLEIFKHFPYLVSSLLCLFQPCIKTAIFFLLSTSRFFFLFDSCLKIIITPPRRINEWIQTTWSWL